MEWQVCKILTSPKQNVIFTSILLHRYRVCRKGIAI
jgi:hypothetical protein